MPIRVQLSRRKGWRMPENTVKVTRPGRFGNPFRIGGYFMIGDPTSNGGIFRMAWCEAVAGYQSDKFTLIESAAQAVDFFKRLCATGYFRGAALAEIQGKNLACWCPIIDGDGNRAPCHADVLLELANAPEKP